MDNSEGNAGPTNAFLMVSNAEFARFLNDAQAHPDDERGTNLWFDADGNVWISPDRRSGRDEAFRVGDSRLLYAAANPPGRRYAVTRATPPDGGTYTDHPVSGVSWFGAMKYCNWLTLDQGLGAGQRAYREGPRQIDWAPVTLSQTNWVDNRFGPAERANWRGEVRGYRLPLLTVTGRQAWADTLLAGAPGTNSFVNPFNEYYKASAWNGGSNVLYGFGRDELDARDANFLDSGAFSWHDTTPGGYYDGTSHGGVFQTRTNHNRYGIYDLSGNVVEWLTDFGRLGSPLDRACYGGSWLFAMSRTHERFFVHPHFTDNFRGFRVVATAPAGEMYALRVPYRVCLCGRGVGGGCGKGREGEEGAGEAVKKLSVEESDGGGTGVLQREKEREQEIEEEKERPQVSPFSPDASNRPRDPTRQPS
jgi:formylglycine-generating enzyme required for sulfatase activity